MMPTISEGQRDVDQRQQRDIGPARQRPAGAHAGPSARRRSVAALRCVPPSSGRACVRRRGRLGSSPTMRPPNITRMRSASEQDLVELDRDQQDGACRRRASSRSWRWMNSMAPMSTPRVGWPTSSTLGLALHLARQHDLLLVAAGEVGESQARVGAAARRSRSISVGAVARDAPAHRAGSRGRKAGSSDSRGWRSPQAAKRRHQAHALAVLRHMGEAAGRASRAGRSACRRAIGLAAESDEPPASARGCRPATSQQLATGRCRRRRRCRRSRRRAASKPTSSSSAHAARVDHGEVLDLSSTSPGCGRRLVDAQQHPAADHQLGQLLGAGLGRAAVGHHLALAHHRRRGR